MAKRWTLYWVSSGTDEDCFVVARNRRSAARVEIEMNGFDPDWVEAERVCVIPNFVKEKYFSAAEDVHQWPWYVYGRAFFEGVGAEFREIEDRLQMLLGEVVYEVEEFIPCSIRRLYSVGGRAVREFEGVEEFQEVDAGHSEPDYLGGIAPFVHEILGRCLLRCQEIEENFASSFVFAALQKNKPSGKTLGTLRDEWRRLTIGQLISTIKRDWDMAPEVDAALDLFKNSRNLFIHRMSTDPRYDISTKWGVMEFIPFIQFFELQTKVILKASRASVAASVSIFSQLDGLPKEFDLTLLEEEHHAQLEMFFTMFWPKGEPWEQAKNNSSSPETRSEK